jgi:DNA-binding PadR family transcriptional regulator
MFLKSLKRGGEGKATVLRGLLELFVMNECVNWTTTKKVLDKIKEETSGNWSPNLAAFYATFRKFEKKGFAKARLAIVDGKKRIEYKLTSSGERELAKRKESMREGIKKNAFVMVRITSYILCGDSEKRFKMIESVKKALGEAYG